MDNFYYNNPNPLNFNEFNQPTMGYQGLFDKERLMNKSFGSTIARGHNHFFGPWLDNSGLVHRTQGWGNPYLPLYGYDNIGFADRYVPSYGPYAPHGFGNRYTPISAFGQNTPRGFGDGFVGDITEQNQVGLLNDHGMGMEGRFGYNPTHTHTEQRIHEPATYLIEENESTVIQLELFGVSEKDFSVITIGNNLIIEGFKEFNIINAQKSKNTQQAKLYFMGPVWHGSFKRVITFDYLLESSAISASFSNGVLTLTVKKPQSHKAAFVKVVSK